jgi:hypothetical protein
VEAGNPRRRHAPRRRGGGGRVPRPSSGSGALGTFGAARRAAMKWSHRSRGCAIIRERGQFALRGERALDGGKKNPRDPRGGTHLMVLPVRMRIHWGMGRFCFCFLPMIFLILKVLWDGCWRWWAG